MSLRPQESPADRAVLIVDDEEGVRFVLSRAVEKAGFVPTAVESAEAARPLLEAQRFFLAFLDVRLPGETGLSLLADLSRREQRPFLVVMTAHDAMTGAVEAMKLGAEECLIKPFDLERVSTLLLDLWARRETQSHKPRKDSDPGALLGKSREMVEVFKLIGRAAKTNLPVLILGESGTGKELVARAIHQSSPRAQGPFVAVNAAALPRELAESELFGHEKGAFTGAGERRRGRFELADQGTVFLDEIGDLPLDLQAKLLRVLQEGEIDRVGSERPVRVNARAIAATNQDLEGAVAAGRFRRDLFYRLDVLPIRLPPLRERGEDIGLLAGHFLSLHGPALKDRPVKLSTDAKKALLVYPWPGNVRELENVVRRAILGCRGNVITEEDLAALLGPAAAPPAVLPRLVATLLQAAPPGEAHRAVLSEVERELLTQTMRQAKGNQLRAAKLLGISRNTLRARLKALGLA